MKIIKITWVAPVKKNTNKNIKVKSKGPPLYSCSSLLLIFKTCIENA